MKSVSSDIYTASLPEYSSEPDDTMFKRRESRAMTHKDTRHCHAENAKSDLSSEDFVEAF